MCLARVYIEDGEQQGPVMQDVAWIEPENGGLQLTTMLGESRLFQAQIKSVDLMNGRIVLRRIPAGSPGAAPGGSGSSRPESVGGR
ncbi:MAG: CooT family nickel-binding protein [Anaerolineae bacterium]|nr:CooT family nickel-binding protein [Anaerolineae bacterium]